MMNLADAIELALKEAGETKSKATARAYRSALTYLAAHLAEWDVSPASPVKSVKIQHLIDFFPYLNEAVSGETQAALTRGTKRVYTAGVKYFVDWLILRGVLKPGYADMLRFEKAAKSATSKREKHFPRTPSLGAAEKVVEAVQSLSLESPMRERDIALVHFLHSSGCRAGEVAALRIGDLDLAERSAIVLGKGDKQRKVFFSPAAAAALREYWAARNAWAGHSHARPDTPVFCRHDPGAGKKRAKPLSTFSVREIVAMAAGLAGLEENFTPHSFRHAFAIEMLRKTRDIAVVQRLLGHEDPATTSIYAEIYPGELMEAHREVWG